MRTVVDGVPVSFTDAGEGKTLVVLQGWGTTAKLYDSIAARLSPRMRVLVPEFPGFGETPEPPEPMDADAMARFALRFLETLGIGDAYLLGHSNGGRIVMKLVGRDDPYPAPRVILMDSAGIVPEKSAGQRLSLGLYKSARRVFETPALKALFPDAVENMRKKRGSADYNAASPVMRATLVKLVNEDLRPLMPRIKCPTLLIWGDNDTATPISDAHIMEKLIPDAGLVAVPGAGHYSYLDAPELVGRVLESFLGLTAPG